MSTADSPYAQVLDAAGSPFAQLLDVCVSCGVRPGRCTGCRLDQPASLAPQLVGASAQVSRMLRTDDVIVTAVHADRVQLIDASGAVFERSADKLRNVRTIDRPDRTIAGSLVAAPRIFDVSQPQRDRLGELAISSLDRSDDATRVQAFSEILELWGTSAAELLDRIPVRDTTRTWLTARHLAAQGDVLGSLRMFATLPRGSFSGRLVYWFSAERRLPRDMRDLVREEAAAFMAGDSIERVAAQILLARLDNRSFDATVGELARQCADLDPVWGAFLADFKSRVDDEVTKLLSGSGEAVEGSFLAQLPLPIVDDLIDAGRISRSSLETFDGSNANYLRARIDPETLSDEAVSLLGMRDEVLRRSIRPEALPPTNLSEEEEETYRTWLAARGGTGPGAVEAAARVVASRASEAATELLLLAKDDTALPTDEVLQEADLYRLLLERAERQPPRPNLDREALTPLQRDFVARSLLRHGKELLHDWRHNDALAAAKRTLQFAQQETVRDEALNLIAACQWLRGEEDSAIAALEAAVAGEYTLPLLANIGVVAAELRPDIAAQRLAKLVAEAPDRPLQLAAARRATLIWSTTDSPWRAESDDLPTELAVPLRRLLVDDIDLADFTWLIRLLADHDREWLSTASLASSPHARTHEAQIFAARAKGPDELVGALAASLRQEDVPAWIHDFRDDLVEHIIQALIADEPDFGAVAFGAAVVEKGLPIPLTARIPLRACIARGVALNIDTEEGEPADRFLDWLIEDQRALNHIPPEERRRAEIALRFGFAALAGSVVAFRFGVWRSVAEAYDEMIHQLRSMPSYRIDEQAVSRAAQRMLAPIRDNLEALARFTPHLDDELGEKLHQLINMNRELADALQQFTR